MQNVIINFSLFVFLLVPLISESAPYYGNGAYADVGANLRYDSNLSLAQSDSDRMAAFINNFNARLGYQKVLNKNSLLNFSTGFAYERVNDFKSLNNYQIYGSANYFLQPIQGFYQPWLEATLRLKNLKFNNSRIRDSLVMDSSLILGKRINRKLTGLLSYNYNERYSEEKVFDLNNHAIGMDLEYGYSRKLTFFSAYNIKFGEVVSTAIPNAKIMSAAESVAPDDAFTAGLGPGCMNRRCAYRLDATSHNLSAGMNMLVGERAEIELASQYHYTNAKGNNQYQGLIHHFSLWYSF